MLVISIFYMIFNIRFK